MQGIEASQARPQENPNPATAGLPGRKAAKRRASARLLLSVAAARPLPAQATGTPATRTNTATQTKIELHVLNGATAR